MLPHHSRRRFDFRARNSLQLTRVRPQDKRTFIKRIVILVEIAPLRFYGWIEPVCLPADSGLNYHMIKRMRRWLPGVKRVSRPRIHESYRTINTHMTQDCEQK